MVRSSPGAVVKAELLNREEWKRLLVEARGKAMDLRLPLTLIGRSLYKWTALEIFGLSGPGKFVDLRPKYKAWKEKHLHFAYPILKASGRLETSLTQPGGENILRFPNATTLEWGTSVPYGIYHQSESPRKKMPRRPFLLVTDARLLQWRNILQSHLHQSFAKPVAVLT
jgi:phage gpG-like protein